jgi:hypothetical protein
MQRGICVYELRAQNHLVVTSYETSGTHMAGKRKIEGKNVAPGETSRPSDNLKAAIEPVATALAEELAALLSAVLDGRKKKTLDRLSQALSDAVPTMLHRVIEEGLLASGDIGRERRAKFATALRAVAVGSSALRHFIVDASTRYRE